MKQIETGGPAFPTENILHKGMTLRDYFAAKAMPWVAGDMPAQENFFERVADQSYKLADAMMERRNATQ
jgi:hypothetical protein